MRIANTKASMAMVMTILLVVGGTGTLVLAVNPFDIAANSPTDTAQHYNMTVKVGVVVEGKKIPIIGAEVSVWSCDVNKTNDSMVITFTRVAHAITGTGGNVTFNLPSGQYIMIANYSGLKAIKQVSLDSDMRIVAILHNCRHCDDGWMWAYRHGGCWSHDDDHEERENEHHDD